MGRMPVGSSDPGNGCGSFVRFLVEHGIDQGHGNGRQPKGLAVARAGEDYVFHAGAAEALRRLFAEHPTDGIAQVGLATSIGAYDGSNAAAIEAELRAITEGFEALQFDAL
jgi:hypothetical protein